MNVNWGDGSPVSSFSVALPGTIPATARTHTGNGNDTVSITVTDFSQQQVQCRDVLRQRFDRYRGHYHGNSAGQLRLPTPG